LACQDEFFVNSQLDVKENDEHALCFALDLSRLFRSQWIWTFPLGGLLFCLIVIIINPALSLPVLILDNKIASLLFLCRNHREMAYTTPHKRT
jgi:hypothetical protein